MPDDVEFLIARLSAPLSPDDRDAFRSAAERALAGIRGDGAAFRAVLPIWRRFFRPVADDNRGAREHRRSKLVSGKALA